MAFSAGDRLGPYEILAPIGAGGMGEVYKARDSRLDRSVAIKVSRQQFSERFEREARAVAALNHPNICTLHDVGPDYLVMEYIEGAPLQGPLPLDQTLKYAAQICDALGAAHRKGIVHRDLKPANILLTRSGIKLLDFGLAKTAITAGPSADVTRTFALTARNEIVGTLYYMSPEQLHAQGDGPDVDSRSDIFSFGVVLYELLTGKHAFEGASAAGVIAGILERPAPSIAGIAPHALDRALQRCLQKAPDDRWQTARDLKAELEWIAAAASNTAEAAVAPSRPLSWMIAAGTLALVAAAGWWNVWRAPKTAPNRPVTQLEFDAGPNDALDPIISPDGTRVVFVSRSDKESYLAMRRLDQTAITRIAGTEGAQLPFFSPDGSSVGFFADRKLKRISLDGLAPLTLTEAPFPGGGSWNEQGSIAAVLNLWTASALDVIPAAGGSPQQLAATGMYQNPQFPHYIRGKDIAFTVLEWAPTTTTSVRLTSPGSKESRELLKNASAARYLAGGYLLFHRDDKVFAASFDPARGVVTGDAVPIAGEVAIETAPQFDVSSGGDMVYRRGSLSRSLVVRLDSTGKQEPLIAAPGRYVNPSLSPDGSKLAITDLSGGGRIFIYDLTRGTLNPLTLDNRPHLSCVWSADGKHIMYRSGDQTWAVRADGGGQPEPFLTDAPVWLSSFSRDGKFAAGYRVVSPTITDLWTAPVEQTSSGTIRLGKMEPVAPGEGQKFQPVFSPDHRWLAYMSSESGRFEVYVISLTPDGRRAGGKWKISSGDGADPTWPAAGSQIFFKGAHDQVVAVSYAVAADSFSPDPPRVWMSRRVTKYPERMFDITRDGKAVAVVDSEAGPPKTHLHVILNLGDEVRRRLPTR